MDLHRIVVYVLDFERYGIEDFKIAIENAVDWASFGDSKTAEIGEWDDEHDMNTGKREAESYFTDPNKPFDHVIELAELSEWNFKRQARIEELEADLNRMKARLDWLILKSHWTSEQMHLGPYMAIDEAMRKERNNG